MVARRAMGWGVSSAVMVDPGQVVGQRGRHRWMVWTVAKQASSTGPGPVASVEFRMVNLAASGVAIVGMAVVGSTLAMGGRGFGSRGGFNSRGGFGGRGGPSWASARGRGGPDSRRGGR